MTTLTSQLQALHDLHLAGMLTDEQFTRAKALLLAKHPTEAETRPGPAPGPPPRPPVVRPVGPGVGLALVALSLFGGALAAAAGLAVGRRIVDRPGEVESPEEAE